MAETDAVIQQALRDEESERKRAKQEKHAADKQRKAARKGMTLEQIEAQEGGPVKESMVGAAPQTCCGSQPLCRERHMFKQHMPHWHG